MTPTETISRDGLRSPRRRKHPASRPRQRRQVLHALYVGLVLDVVATAAPYVDRATSNVLAHHIQNGYPSYTQGRIDTAVTRWLVILTVVGLLGLAGWVWTIWAVRTDKSWARWAASLMFALGISTSLTILLVKDTSGAIGMAPVLGVIGMAPCVPGVVAVASIWRNS